MARHVGHGSGTPSTHSFAPLVVLLTLTMAIGPYSVHAISVLAPFITEELSLSHADLGWTVTVAFAVGTMTATLGGRLNERLGNRRLLLLIYALAGLGILAVSTSRHLYWLLIATGLAGFPLSAANPVTNRLISVRLPLKRQGIAVGVKQSGVQFSQLICGVSLPSLAIALGWRVAVSIGIVFAGIGIAVTALLVEREDEGLQDQRDIGAGVGTDVGVVVRWLSAYALMTGMAITATTTYLPLYAFEELHFKSTVAGAIVAMMGIVGVISRVAWGGLSHRLMGARTPLLALGIISTTGISLIAITPYTDPSLVWFGAFLFAGGAMASNAIVMMSLVATISFRDLGRASSRVVLWMYFGFMIGPVTFGQIMQQFQRYGVAWSFVFACAASTIAICVAWGRRDAISKSKV
jgi:MFS family permease